MKILVALSMSFLLSSCILNDKIGYYKGEEAGVEINGRMPWWAFGFVSASSPAHHIYNYLCIDYNKLEGNELDNINLCFYGRKIELNAISYDEIMEIAQGLPENERQMIIHHHVVQNETDDEISFYFTDKEEIDRMKKLPNVRFFFEAGSKRMLQLYVFFRLPCNTDAGVVKFENTANGTETPFPCREPELISVFGEGRIYEDCSL